MHLEEFAEGNSFIHRLDPRVKFLTITPFVFIIAAMKGVQGPFVALIAAIILALFARLNLKKILIRLLAVNVFILFLWFFLPFSHPGETMFQIGFLTATREGVMLALSITLKSNAIVIMTIAILGTSEVFTLAHALIHLKIPRKLVLLFFFFYRYIAVIHMEYTKLRKSMRIRCFKPINNIHTYRTFAYLVGMLIIKGYDRSNRIYNAMLCRGFKNNFPLISHFQLNKTDIAFCLGMIGVMLLLVKTFGFDSN